MSAPEGYQLQTYRYPVAQPYQLPAAAVFSIPEKAAPPPYENERVIDWDRVTQSDFQWFSLTRSQKNEVLQKAAAHLAASIHAANRLGKALAKAGKSHSLVISAGTGATWQISRKDVDHLVDENAKFVTSLVRMTRRSRRKPKDFAAKQAEGLRGTFGPVYFRSTPLHQLLTSMVSVVNDLPGIQRGFATRATLTALLHMYVSQAGLRDPKDHSLIRVLDPAQYPDDPHTALRILFDAPNTRPPFISYYDITQGSKKVRRPLNDQLANEFVTNAQTRGVQLTAKDFTTFGIISMWNNHTEPKRFTHDQFHSSYLQIIASLNYYTVGNVSKPTLVPAEKRAEYAQILAILEDSTNRAQMLADYKTVKAIKEQLETPKVKQERDQRKKEQGKAKRQLVKQQKEQKKNQERASLAQHGYAVL